MRIDSLYTGRTGFGQTSFSGAPACADYTGLGRILENRLDRSPEGNERQVSPAQLAGKPASASTISTIIPRKPQ